MNNNEFKCSYIFKKGKKKGILCGKHVEKGYLLCSLHKKKWKNTNTNSNIHNKNQVPPSEEIIVRELEEKILKLDTTIDNKVIMFKHLNNLKTLDQGSSEYYKNNMFLDWCFTIPWNKYKQLELTIDSEKELIRLFFENVKKELDENIYGLTHVKNEILNFVAKRITNPLSEKNNLGLIGPPGVAKTTFAKVLSKVLNIPLKIIPLGGVKDSSYFTGHGYVYVESSPGHIIQSVVDSKVMNPILLFDEVDKVSESNLGSDIQSFLINLIDPTTNSKFVDHYFQRMTFDLSKVLYIFTMNDLSKVNKVLLDRLNMIYIKEPTVEEKKKILIDYCLPDIKLNIGVRFNIEIEKEALDYLFNRMEKLSESSAEINFTSIRNLTRILEKIILEINKRSLIGKDIYSNIVINKEYMIELYDLLKTQFDYNYEFLNKINNMMYI